MPGKPRTSPSDVEQTMADGSQLLVRGRYPADLSPQEVVRAIDLRDVLGHDGILARLLAGRLEQLLDAELAQPTLPPDPAPVQEVPPRKGRTSPSSAASVSSLVAAGAAPVSPATPNGRPTDIEEHVIALYARGLSLRDIQETLRDTLGVDLSPNAISTITDKVWTQVEAWQSRPLSAIYPIVYLDALHLKLRREGKVVNTAVYIVLGLDLEGQREVLGHWVGDGSESANFWLSVVTDLQTRGVQDIFIACVDGLAGFTAAIHAVFPATHIQRCVIHQVRQSLGYVTWKDRKDFATDLKAIYGAPTREAAETRLWRLGERWGKTYAIATRSWETHWGELALLFDYPADIRRLIYTTNLVESYNAQIRRVIRNKAAFPSAEAVRKLLFLANRTITARWGKTFQNWPAILNQLAIRFEGRFPA